MAREAGDRVVAAYLGWEHGNWERAQGNWSQALSLYIAATRALYAMKHVWGATFCVESLAYLNATLDQPQRAAVLLGAAKSLRELVGYPRAPLYHAEHDACRAKLQAALPDFGELWHKGTQMAWQQVFDFAFQTPDFVVLPDIEYSIPSEPEA